VEKSKKRFDVSGEKTQKDKVTDVARVESFVQFQLVIVEGKVVKFNQAMKVSGGRKKQDLVVVDSTGSSRLTVWEEVIGTVVEGKCYRFTGMMVRVFKLWASSFGIGMESESMEGESEDVCIAYWLFSAHSCIQSSC